MSPLRNLLRGTKMSHGKTHLRSETTGGTRRLVTEPDFLLTKQMYMQKFVHRLSFASALKKTKNDAHYMFQTNSAVKQTEGLNRHSLEYSEFLVREPIWPRSGFPLFSGLEVNTCVFQEVYVCVIFFSIMLPYLMALR